MRRRSEQTSPSCAHRAGAVTALSESNQPDFQKRAYAHVIVQSRQLERGNHAPLLVSRPSSRRSLQTISEAGFMARRIICTYEGATEQTDELCESTGPHHARFTAGSCPEDLPLCLSPPRAAGASLLCPAISSRRGCATPIPAGRLRRTSCRRQSLRLART